MHGNVWEWVEDCFHFSYAGAPTDGSAWISGGCYAHVRRGGAWSSGPRNLRAAARIGINYADGNRLNNYGFRLARALSL